MASELNASTWDDTQLHIPIPNEGQIPQGCVWVPCIPDYTTNSYIPIYNLYSFPILNPLPQPAGPVKTNIKAKISRGGLKTKPWKENEDQLLRDLISQYGTKNWAFISKSLNEALYDSQCIRKGKHCRERWHNHLNPELNKGEWSYEEDIKLLNLKQKVGNKWSIIAKDLPGRTENGVKNRWNSLMKKAKCDSNLACYSNDVIACKLIEDFEKERLNKA
ncbi:MYBL2_4 [Blepharisma stoltei]|uniref:Uncharacterized protein n=1 Tax=Blepharisma stoltei TaxID=1481888 RepID=A0AAU9JAC9_9CILI|nr:unnamed protein product [Blepharisma stoltei]